MFTAQAPLMLQSLQGVPADTARQLTQVFANCNQALNHRSGVSLSRGANPNAGGMVTMPPWSTGSAGGNGVPFGTGDRLSGGYYGGNYYGVDGPRSSYTFNHNLGSQLAANYSIYNEGDFVGGSPFNFSVNSPYRGGDTFIQQGDSPYYDMTTRTTNQSTYEYGGPVFQVAGDTYLDNSITNHSTVNNQYVTNQTVNRTRVVNLSIGEPGDPGAAGPAGAAGAAGNPGAAGPAGADGAVLFAPGPLFRLQKKQQKQKVQGRVRFNQPLRIRIPSYECDPETGTLHEVVNLVELNLNNTLPEFFNGETVDPVLQDVNVVPVF